MLMIKPHTSPKYTTQAKIVVGKITIKAESN